MIFCLYPPSSRREGHRIERGMHKCVGLQLGDYTGSTDLPEKQKEQ